MHCERERGARGINYPLPVLRTQKALFEMSAGQVLRVLTTDESSSRDFRTFARLTGNELLAFPESDAVFEFFLRRRQGQT